VTILTNYIKQLPGKNLLALFSISSLGNRKLNICCDNLIISILQVWNSFILWLKLTVHYIGQIKTVKITVIKKLEMLAV